MNFLDKGNDETKEMPRWEGGNFNNYRDWLRYTDLINGVILLDETIREYSASAILSEIRDIKRRKLHEVNVVISSPGGGAYYAFAIYDALRELSEKGIKVKAVVQGWAASAAAMIVLQAADERIAYPSARFLVHECRRWVFFAVERSSDLKDEVKEMDAITERIFEIMSNRCKKTREEIHSLIERKEIWMSANEAKDWGLIDKIL